MFNFTLGYKIQHQFMIIQNKIDSIINLFIHNISVDMSRTLDDFTSSQENSVFLLCQISQNVCAIKLYTFCNKSILHCT